MFYKSNYLSFATLVLLVFSGCNEKNEPLNSKQQVQFKESPTTLDKNTTQNLSTSIQKETIDTTIQAKKEIDTNIEEKICIPEKVEGKPQYYQQETLKRTSCEAKIENLNQFGFDIIKKGVQNDNTLLVVGGIQGDEPGGFMAASLIATHYEIKKGSVWVIPNLNFYSIIKRSRGPYGDMNRKFASLDPNDPEYEIIQRVKSFIKNENVKMIVNLHDGSGYYRPKYEDSLHSPHRWGQCTIIDQSNIKSKKFSNLEDISTQVVQHVNKNLLKKEHKYHLHNTRTAEGDKEMEKTLTYFAINNGKAAFGNEASKELPTHQRVYYHLLALEKFMHISGVKFERKFNLNADVVKNILDNDIEIAFYGDKIKLPLGQVRNMIKYFPVKKDGTIDFTPSNPLMSIVREHDVYTIYYGNRRLSKLSADFVEHAHDNIKAKFLIDGIHEEYSFGDKIKVENDFLIKPLKGYRINVIGYTNKSKIETDKLITKNSMLKRFSIDQNGNKYRVEFYKDEKFAGMIVVDFAN